MSLPRDCSDRMLFRWISGLLLGMALLGATTRAQSASPHSVTLAWQAPSPIGGSGTIGGYNVYRSTSGATSYTKVNTALIAGLTFTDNTVTPGAGYSYCVSTVDSLNDESACSAPVTATVPTNPNPPSAPVVTVK